MFLAFLFLSLPIVSANAKAAQPIPELVVSTYDSLAAKNGLGPAIFPIFEKKYGCRIKVLSSGDGGQMVSRLQLDAERGHPTAQVVLGLDQQSFERAKPWIEDGKGWTPRGVENVRSELRGEPGFLPFDYGVFAFMSDQEALTAAGLQSPLRLADLMKPEWKRNLILEDPRTSTPGLAFVLYMDFVYGKSAAEAWRSFRNQWLTLAPGWDAAYGLFLKKEAPLVWSYTSSQAYHEEHGDHSGRYRALIFEEGQPMQVEGAALVKGSLNDPATRKLAQRFLEFLITPEVQALIPLKNWMLPVTLKAKLPASFRHLPRPVKTLHIPSDQAHVDRALGIWRSALDSAR